MDKKDEKQGKKCFIITPIGNENSDTFRKAKGVIESVIKPILMEYGFNETKPAYEINESGKIGQQVIEHIVNDDLAVANLTGNNPNVMYELAVRHMTGKPIINICECGTELPFDIIDDRTIFFVNDMLGVQELRTKLSCFMEELKLDREYTSNPILSFTKTQLNFPEVSSMMHHLEQIHRNLGTILFNQLPKEKRKVWVRVILYSKKGFIKQEHDIIKLCIDIATRFQEMEYYFDAKNTGTDLFLGEMSFVSANPSTLLLEDLEDIVKRVCENCGMDPVIEITYNILQQE